MLEGLRALGNAYLEYLEKRTGSFQEALLYALVQVDDILNRQGQDEEENRLFIIPLHLAQVNNGWTLKVEDPREATLDLLYKALWIGHADRKRYQDRATVQGREGLAMLISQALPA